MHSMKTLFVIIIAFAVTLTGCRSFFSNSCKRLQQYGFGYKKEKGNSPSWDIITFYFYNDSGRNSGIGPEISGDRLKVTCDDVDNDGVDEFIIQSNLWKTYQTVLKVSPDSGKYHIQYNEGLNINYPIEGYYYR